MFTETHNAEMAKYGALSLFNGKQNVLMSVDLLLLNGQ
jgi:hypothetical protein